MIITLVGANFSSSNIGTLSTWRISTSLGSGATYSGPDSVERDPVSSLSATVTIGEGYEIGAAGVSVTMGGAAVTSGVTVSGDGKTVTISIAEVTGNVSIKVPTKNLSSGEEDEGGSGGDSGDSPGGADVILNLSDYATYIGCIAGSTNTIQGGTKGSTTKGNMFYKIPLADFTNPTSVTVVAGASTKAYVAFFNTVTLVNGETPPYAGGATAQTILDAGASQTFTIPSDAVCMYILATNGSGSSLRPASVTFHNATYKGSSDPADGSSSGGESSGTTTGTAFDTTWVFGKTLSSSSGELTDQSTYAATQSTIDRPSGKNLKYIPHQGDEYGLWLVIGTFNGSTFIERKTFDPAVVTSETTITLDSEVTKVRLAYGRTSSSEITMDQTSLDYLNLAWV